MFGLETNLKSTRPRPGHYETKTKTASKRPRPGHYEPRPRPQAKDRDRDPDWSQDLHHCTIMHRVKKIWKTQCRSKRDLHSGPSVPRNLER